MRVFLLATSLIFMKILLQLYLWTNKFWKSSGSGCGSVNFYYEFLPLWNRGNSMNSAADNSRSCRESYIGV